MFLRTVYISSVVIFCLIAGFFGIARAYSRIRLVAFGEYRSAIEIEDGTIKFFDYEIEIN